MCTRARACSNCSAARPAGLRRSAERGPGTDAWITKIFGAEAGSEVCAAVAAHRSHQQPRRRVQCTEAGSMECTQQVSYDRSRARLRENSRGGDGSKAASRGASVRTAATPWAGPKAQPAPAQSDCHYAGRGAPYAANADAHHPKPASTSKLTAPVNFGDRRLRWMSTEVLAAHGPPPQARLSRAAAGTTCAAAQPSGWSRGKRVGDPPCLHHIQRARNPTHAPAAQDTDVVNQYKRACGQT